jgi:hypothetical protein
MFGGDLGGFVNSVGRHRNGNNFVVRFKLCNVPRKDALLHVAKEEPIHTFEQGDAFLSDQVFNFSEPGGL